MSRKRKRVDSVPTWTGMTSIFSSLQVMYKVQTLRELKMWGTRQEGSDSLVRSWKCFGRRHWKEMTPTKKRLLLKKLNSLLEIQTAKMAVRHENTRMAQERQRAVRRIASKAGNMYIWGIKDQSLTTFVQTGPLQKNNQQLRRPYYTWSIKEVDYFGKKRSLVDSVTLQTWHAHPTFWKSHGTNKVILDTRFLFFQVAEAVPFRFQVPLMQIVAEYYFVFKST
jgi:hypothetical protein